MPHHQQLDFHDLISAADSIGLAAVGLVQLALKDQMSTNGI